MQVGTALRSFLVPLYCVSPFGCLPLQSEHTNSGFCWESSKRQPGYRVTDEETHLELVADLSAMAEPIDRSHGQLEPHHDKSDVRGGQ